MIGSATAGQSVNAAVYTPPPSASDELVGALFGPVVAVLSKTIAEATSERLRQNDRRNAQTHIDAVRSHVDGESGHSRFEEAIAESSTRTAEDFRDWSKRAGGVGPDGEPIEVAAWRAALEDIILRRSDRMLVAVKSLSLTDLQFLIANPDKTKIAFEVPSRLVGQEIYTRGAKLHMIVRRAVFLLLGTTTPVLVTPFLQNIAPFRYDDRLNNLLNAFQLPWIVMSIGLAGIACIPMIGFRITPFGEELLHKITTYMPDLKKSV